MTRRFAGAVILSALVGCNEPAPPAAPADAAGATPVPVPVALGRPDLPARPLVFGRPPHLPDTRDEYKPLADYLGRAIGHRIVVRVPGSYDEVVDQMAAGQIDIAMLTPFTYVKAHDRIPGLVLLASILGEGSPKYRGYIVAKLGSPIRELADLKGTRFAFVDRGSASGYLFPLALLREAGLEPQRDFASVSFAHNHPAVVHGILAGTYDAGAVSSTTFQHMRGEALQDKLNIVAKTEWIPLDAMVAHPSLPAALTEELRRILIGLSMRTADGRAVLHGVTTTNGFVPGDDAAYDPVRRVAHHVAEETAALQGSSPAGGGAPGK